MLSGEEDPRARAPLFFLSYAHSIESQQDRFIRFFNDLSENVAELVSRPAGSDPGYMGYMDRSMRGGNRWAGELLEAVGTCQVFVALLSAPYFESTWCSMEWFAFSQRRVQRYSGDGPERQTALVPVLWAAPLPRGQTPTAIRDVQLFSPNGLSVDIARKYQAEGVVGLLLTQIDSYHAVVWKLAQQVAGIYYSYYVEPRVFLRHELRDIFRGRREK